MVTLYLVRLKGRVRKGVESGNETIRIIARILHPSVCTVSNYVMYINIHSLNCVHNTVLGILSAPQLTQQNIVDLQVTSGAYGGS